MIQEELHLAQCRERIEENIARYEALLKDAEKESEDLFRAVRSGDTELYGQLIVSENMREHYSKTLLKNRTAYNKPYFGRIDYKELETGTEEMLYIGKNGITLKDHEVIVVDWRAPAATVYYENTLGEGSYRTVGGKSIPIDLYLKRTFDISEGKLQGYYDSDTVANDELLVKYLSQNKDVVLGDIISTIQKEQDEIIRKTPYKNILVQGVAGSGKTTVAMHRISYILYNYGKQFAPEEFCIIAASDMLLRYITSGLPELDVENVSQMRMDRFLLRYLDKSWKKNDRYIEMDEEESFKSRLEFIQALDNYLEGVRKQALPDGDIVDTKAGILMSGEDIRDILERNKERSVAYLSGFLNERLGARIKMLLYDEEDAGLRKVLVKQYKNTFVWKKTTKAADVYVDFLMWYALVKGDGACMDSVIAHVQKHRFDIYDLAALALIEVRLLAKETYEDYRQIIVDETQDFGESVYYVLRQMLPGCYFTLMGDVSQNIHYDTGMNSWEDLKNDVFGGEHMSFHILAKSYRNTIEISEYAGHVLQHANAGAYKIQPVIRHGSPVGIWKCGEEGMSLEEACRSMASKALEILSGIESSGYDTTAVICRDESSAAEAAQYLGISAIADGEESFHKGVMVLPVAKTKGLEFDAVILWNPSPESYGRSEGDAKLLYVAITRALHELHVVYCGELTPLSQ